VNPSHLAKTTQFEEGLLPRNSTDLSTVSGKRN